MFPLAEYKLKLFVDAVQAHFDQEPISNFTEDDLAAFPEATQFQLGSDQFVLPELAGSWNKEVQALYADESGDDIAADLIEIQAQIRKSRRKLAQQKWNQSEAGQAAKKAWNESNEAKEAKEAWNESEAGQATKKAWRQSEAGKEAEKAWRQSEAGRLSTNATKRKQTLDQYLNRRIVAVDSEGRCPLHMINTKGQTPLEASKETGCEKYLQKDSTGHYWEAHELSLIGAASITRPYGTPIEKGAWSRLFGSS